MKKIEERLTLKLTSKGYVLGLTIISRDRKNPCSGTAISNFQRTLPRNIDVKDQFIVLEPGSYLKANRKNYISNCTKRKSVKYIVVKSLYRKKLLDFLPYYFTLSLQGEVKVDEVSRQKIGSEMFSIFRLRNCCLSKIPRDIERPFSELRNVLVDKFQKGPSSESRYKRGNRIISIDN